MVNKTTKYTGGGLIFFLLILISLYYQEITLLFLHSLINIFASGRSYIKVYLFIIYLTLLWTAGLILKNKIKPNNPFFSKLTIVLLFTILYISNFITTLILYKNYAINFNEQITIFSQDNITSTRIFHSHVFKGLAAFMTKLFGLNPLSNVDSGGSFLNLFPTYLFIIVGLVLLFLLMYVILYYLKSLHSLNKPRQLIYIVIYSIVTFSLFKNVIDGGLLNPETIISLIFLIILLFKNRVAHKIGLLIAISYLILCLISYKYNFWLNNQGINEIQHAVAYISLLSFLYYYYLYGIKDRLTKKLFCLAVLLILIPIKHDLAITQYRSISITQKDDAILASYEKITNREYQLKSSLGNLNFYHITPDNAIKIRDVIKKFNLLDNHYPISVPWATCLPYNVPTELNFDVISFERLNNNFKLDDKIYIKKFTTIAETTLYRYKISLVIDNCLPRPLNIINEIINLAGGKNFIISHLESK